MKNKKEIVKANEVEFHGQTLLTIKINDKFYAAIKPISDKLGLAWQGQQQKIMKSKRYQDILIPFRLLGVFKICFVFLWRNCMVGYFL